MNHQTDKPTTRPTRAEISLSALRHNFSITRSLAGDAKMMAVVKAEAYGHGLVRMATEFAVLGADWLGVSFLEEGVKLREEGIDLPILVMGGLVDEQISRYLDYDLDITVSSVWKARRVDEVASAWHGHLARVHLKFDTGMGRIGQNWQTAELLLRAASELKHTEIRGIYTHLATADEPDQTGAIQQLDRFDEIVSTARRMGIEPPLIHAANSAALMRFPDRARYTLVRPGIILYGIPPSASSASSASSAVNLNPVMTLKSRVVFVKKPPAGTPIGYGATWNSPGGRWIATLPIGYGDGYPRNVGNRGWVMLRGRKCPVVGRVSMDQITIDAGDEAWLGDEAVLFGSSSDQSLPIWELSQALDTIPYELLCRLTARVPRIYLD